MKKLILYALSIASLCILYSCNKNKVDPSFEENIKIKMIESVDSVNRTLYLSCITEKIFECANFKIERSYKVSGNKITIKFTGIYYPNICLTATGPASTLIELKGLENKTYDLEISSGTNKITGQLNVTSNSYSASLPPQTKVQIINPELGRIPDNTIYGMIHYHSAATSPLVENFIDTLQMLGAAPITLPEGDYGDFQIDANGQIVQNQDLGYYFTRHFIFNYSNSSGDLKGLVRRFGVNYPDLLLVTLNTTKGETFNSWKE